MTPQILLDTLRKAYINFEAISFIVLDECHRASGNHPYTKIMKVSLICLFPYPFISGSHFHGLLNCFLKYSLS